MYKHLTLIMCHGSTTFQGSICQTCSSRFGRDRFQIDCRSHWSLFCAANVVAQRNPLVEYPFSVESAILGNLSLPMRTHRDSNHLDSWITDIDACALVDFLQNLIAWKRLCIGMMPSLRSISPDTIKASGTEQSFNSYQAKATENMSDPLASI